MNSLQSFVCFLLQGRLFCNNFGQLGIWHLDSCSLDVLGSNVWPEWHPRGGLRVDTYCGKMAIFGILFSLFCTFCSWSELFAIIKNFLSSFIQLFVWSEVLTKRRLRMESYCGKMAIFGILFSLFCTFCSRSELFAIIKNFFFPHSINSYIFF